MIRSGASVVGFALLVGCSPAQSPAKAAPSAPAPAPVELAAPAQAPAQAAPTETAPMPAPQIAGGYGAADLDSADAKAALALATAELYRKFPQRGLVEKTSAEVQVVAGLNYRFDMQMTGGKHYIAVVYKPLQGAMTVSSVEEAK